MNSQIRTGLLTLTAVLSCVHLAVGGQHTTPWGDPDLQGVWTNDVVTPLERPIELGKREVLTEEELAQASEANERRQLDTGRPRSGDPILLQGYNQFWMPRRNISHQTSLVVDPEDGQIPSQTPEGQQRANLVLESSQGIPAKEIDDRRGTDGPEQRSLWERCLTRGLPRLPDFYNNNFLLLQTPKHVVILMEMIHEVRVIPVDGRPHADGNIRQWLGDPRGHWDGDTLVVESTNFSDKANFKGSRDTLRLIERFTRTDAGTIRYEVTVDDPTTWTQSWTARIPLRRSDGPLFEYACHEGNYAMTNTLRGARTEEKELK